MDVEVADIGKRLIDYGFHPPTVSFPLIVPGAIMIEPTETESQQETRCFYGGHAGDRQRGASRIRSW